ncbi:hypothetical protein Gogos_005526 [Gossypium gossypioides]|uniref:DUF4283 domain-containing protein n=1 Tax=Gossypium gossypioides TaxID=34282 RepID=A0A7J9D1R7_GOSGO|nr:hypothetical protein [Gossypium gossypioides]
MLCQICEGSVSENGGLRESVNLVVSPCESKWVISTKRNNENLQGYEVWAVGKIMAKEKLNREAMYRVLKSLWFTKDEVNFVAFNKDVILVKFGDIEDRTRILNLMPWLFNQCLFAMLPFIKGQELKGYDFNINPFWIRIFNIPLEQMDRQMAIDVGKAIEVVVAIDWRDRE